MANFLVVISDRFALGWVLRTSQMAFPSTSRSEVDSLMPGDALYVYTTRLCFGNPRRDRGRVIGRATVATDVGRLSESLTVAKRVFERGCAIKVESLAPFGDGVELAPLVDDLNSFSRYGAGAGWAIRLRRPLVRLDAHDAGLLDSELAPRAGRPPHSDAVAQYAHWWDESTEAAS